MKASVIKKKTTTTTKPKQNKSIVALKPTLSDRWGKEITK